MGVKHPGSLILEPVCEYQHLLVQITSSDWGMVALVTNFDGEHFERGNAASLT